MSRRIKMLMAESRRGSISALSQLSQFFSSNVSLFVEALPIVFQHLRIADIPPEPFPWQEDVNNAHMGRLTVLCLEILRDQLFSESMSRPIALSAVLPHIAKVWPLPAFLLDRLQTARCSVDERKFQHDVHDITVEIFMVLTSDDDVRTKISEPGMVTILTQIWMLEVEVASSSQSASMILGYAAMNQPSNVSFPDMEPLLVSEEEFVSFVLNQLDERTDKLQLALLQFLVVLLKHWSLSDPDDVGMRFTEAGSIQAVCNILRRLSSPKTFARLQNDPGSPIILPHIFQYSTIYLFFCIEMGGPRAAVKAIDHRLILSLVRSRDFLQAEDRDGMMDTDFTDLFRTMERCLVYPEVLQRAAKSVRTVRRLNLDSPRSDETNTSPVFVEIWSSFTSVVEGRTEYKREWDRGLLCHNPSHHEVGSLSNRFCVCSRCFETYYCSRTCQKAHWKTGEDITCNRKIDSDPVPSCLDDRRDYVFLSAMVDHDLKHAVDSGHFISAREQYLAENPEADPKTLVAFLDYSEGPYSFSIMSDAALRDAGDISKIDEKRAQTIGSIEPEKRSMGYWKVVSKMPGSSSSPWINIKLLHIVL
ncbi:hypothetical protein C8J56DRAFT_1075577 [Mycena floridula]|nr:hypothetical protein C8J56DRAFT_1075577 [Mycena floridula]